MNPCGEPQCGVRHRAGSLRPGWESIQDGGVKLKLCPECFERRCLGELEPEPPYATPVAPRPKVPVVHEPTPPAGATCAHEQCGQSRGRGHPPDGWVRLWITGPDAHAVWFCSTPCAVVALSPMVRLPLPRVEREWVNRLTVQAALDLLVAGSGQPMTIVNLTGWRVRRSYELAVARLDPEQPGWLAHRGRLAAARGRLLVECNEPKPSEIDDDLDDDEELGADPFEAREAS